jgi:hypothetical protein
MTGRGGGAAALGRGGGAAALGRDAAGWPADVIGFLGGAGRFRDVAGFFLDPVPDFATLLL